MSESIASRKDWKSGQNGKGDASRVQKFSVYQANLERIFRRTRSVSPSVIKTPPTQQPTVSTSVNSTPGMDL